MSYRQLSAEERTLIAKGLNQGLSQSEIGRRLGRAPSTVCRELARNHALWNERIYMNTDAQVQALRRRRQARHRRRLDRRALVRYVLRKLTQGWSPQIIAGRLRRAYPHQEHMRLSAETIYRWIYRDEQCGGSLWQWLHSKHRRRQRQVRYGTGRRHRLAGRVGIEQRQLIVATRGRFGDWEGDSIIGRAGKSAIASSLERKSRWLSAAKLSDRGAMSWSAQAIAAFKRLPGRLRRTLTVDNGSEFYRFAMIERAASMRVYFADPYAAWQRGAIENANGILRRYLPKGTDFNRVSHQTLARIVRMINHRPRKCLDYQTPHEVFQRARRIALGM